MTSGEGWVLQLVSASATHALEASSALGCEQPRRALWLAPPGLNGAPQEHRTEGSTHPLMSSPRIPGAAQHAARLYILPHPPTSAAPAEHCVPVGPLQVFTHQ